MNDVDPYQRALESYELAYSRVVQARSEWECAGRPLVVEHRNRMLGVAPIWRALREAVRDAARALEVIRTRHSGPISEGARAGDDRRVARARRSVA